MGEINRDSEMKKRTGQRRENLRGLKMSLVETGYIN